MTTAWYYDYYEKGVFPHQQHLCDAVRWTECNLEGQRLVSPTHLSAILANPLTIRLFTLREALNQLRSNVNTIDGRIKKQVEKQFDKGKFFVMEGTFKAQDSSIETRGAPVETIKIGESKPFEFQHFMVHLALYEFFTNFGSVLDRLAYEINMLYDLGIGKLTIDWGQLTKTPKLTKEGKNKDLADLLKDYARKLETATRYRNRIVHDGMIRVEVNISFLGLSIRLMQHPNNDTSPMDVDAIEFCEKTKADVLKLLDGSYELMLQYLQTHGKPPW